MQLTIGQKAPDFILPSHLGTDIVHQRLSRQERRARVFPTGLDADMNEPDPVL